jgi:hypothetical protein
MRDRQPQRLVGGPHSYVEEPGVPEEPFDRRRRAQREDRADEPRGLVSHVPREGFVEHVEEGIRRGYAHEDPSAGNQHATHFSERGCLVRHEL